MSWSKEAGSHPMIARSWLSRTHCSPLLILAQARARRCKLILYRFNGFTLDSVGFLPSKRAISFLPKIILTLLSTLRGIHLLLTFTPPVIRPL